MPRLAKRIWFLIRRDHLDQRPVGSVLDMLRFDHATVESYPPEGFYLFAVDHRPTLARWESFGIKVHAFTLEESEYYPDWREPKSAWNLYEQAFPLTGLPKPVRARIPK